MPSLVRWTAFTVMFVCMPLVRAVACRHVVVQLGQGCPVRVQGGLCFGAGMFGTCEGFLAIDCWEERILG
jgi:hypothetical protein